MIERREQLELVGTCYKVGDLHDEDNRFASKRR